MITANQVREKLGIVDATVEPYIKIAEELVNDMLKEKPDWVEVSDERIDEVTCTLAAMLYVKTDRTPKCNCASKHVC